MYVCSCVIVTQLQPKKAVHNCGKESENFMDFIPSSLSFKFTITRLHTYIMNDYNVFLFLFHWPYFKRGSVFF